MDSTAGACALPEWLAFHPESWTAAVTSPPALNSCQPRTRSTCAAKECPRSCLCETLLLALKRGGIACQEEDFSHQAKHGQESLLPSSCIHTYNTLLNTNTMLSFTRIRSWRASPVSAVHFRTVRTSAGERRECPSLNLITCVCLHPMFAFRSFFNFWYLPNCYLLAEGKFK